MKVILSWSGERSKAVAEALRGWLHKVVQAADTWMSDKDIEKGSIWPEALMEQLTDASYGIICVTPENQAKPWIAFETGAIATKFGKAYACPLLFKMEKSQLTGPLSLLQATILDKGDFKALVRNMNAAAMAKKEKGLGDQDLDEMFEDLWPKLQAKLDAIPAPKEKAQPERGEREILDEVLLKVRAIAQGVTLSEDERARLQWGYGAPADPLGFGATWTPATGMWGKKASEERMQAFARAIAAGAPSNVMCNKCGGELVIGFLPANKRTVYVCRTCGYAIGMVPLEPVAERDPEEPAAPAAPSPKK
jgi:hypothetical protein